MRIRLKRGLGSRQKSKYELPPAPWQEFIEI